MRWLRGLRSDRDSRRVPLAEPLEPRLLYSADLGAGLMLATSTTEAAPEVRTLAASGEYAAATPAATDAAALADAFLSTSLAFEANQGQAAAGVDYVAQGSGYGIALSGGNAQLTLAGTQGIQAVTLTLQGANASVAQGEDLQATRSNYILGSDASQWQTGIANYAAVRYANVYDGIDVRYYGTQRQLEYDFVVAAGADAAAIRLQFQGAASVAVDADGNLVLQVAGSDSTVRFKAPVSYQRGADGQLEAVASRYEVRADGTVGFVLGDYDHARELVIDPVLDYATYFGDSGSETALAVATDAAGNVYITGRTSAVNASSGPLAPVIGGGGGSGDLFVAKFNADLSQLLWATRIGGSSDDQGNAIAVDASGNVAVTGWTKSSNFPTQNASQGSLNGGQDAVVLKLNASGGLVFSSYLGGTGSTDSGNAVAFDSAGNLYAAGQQSDTGLLSLALQLLFGNSDNAYVNKYDAAGSLAWSQLLGGTATDLATGIAVDGSGNAYVVGNTQSTDLAIAGGEQSALSGAIDGFLVRLDASGNTVYSTYVGGSDADTTKGVAIDGSGKAYVVGVTRARASVVFTTTAGAFMTSSPANNKDTGFLRIYDTTQTGAASLLYSSYLGGSGSDLPSGVAYANGRVVIVGVAGSTDFPLTPDALQATNPGSAFFIVVLDPAGNGSGDLRFGSYYGANMAGGAVAVHGSQVYFAGGSGATDYATSGSYQVVKAGGTDVLIVGIGNLLNTAPAVAGVVQPPAILEDSGAGGGFTVASLLAGQVTDPDAGALQGIAIVASDDSNGTWQFSLDNGGTWSAVGATSAGSALLLAADLPTRLRFVPAADYSGASTLTVRAWDRTSGTAGSRASITSTGGATAYSAASVLVSQAVTPVNDLPVRTAGNVVDLTVVEDSGSTSLGLAGIAFGPGGGSDEAAQALTYAVTALPAGSLGVVTLADGTVVTAGSYTLAQIQGMRFVAAADAVGTGTFSFQVQDNGGGADTLVQSLQITVTAVNDPPVRTAGTVANLTLAEDSGSTSLGLAGIAFGPGGGSDEAAQALTYAVTALPAGSLGVVTLADGTVVTAGSYTLAQIQGMRFVAAANANGAGTFTFRVQDNGGGTDTLVQSLLITVTPVNDAPTTSAVTLPTMQEDGGTVTITSAQLLANAGDVDGDTLSIANLSASAGTLVNNGNGTWSFTPAANFNGPVAFSYDVTDGVAATAGTASLQVQPVNDAPVTTAVALPGMNEDGGSVTITSLQLLANASDADADTLSVVGLVASSGSLVDNGNGTWTFTPGANANGTVAFSYGVSDGTATTAGSATLVVAPVNDAPTTSAVTLPTMQEDGGTVTITSAQLLAKAGDVDGDALSIANLSASAGTLVNNGNGTWSFTPAANFNGPVAFSYDVTDGVAATAGTASLQVQPVNDAPVTTAVALPAVAEDSGPLTLTQAQLLANAGDIDGDALSVLNLAANSGTLVANGNGTWTFTPGADYNGTVAFTYDVSDGTATTAGAATLQVTPVNDAPATLPVALAPVAEDSGAVVITSSQLLANASDVDGDTLSVTNLAASAGTLVDNGNGTWTFTPGANFNGPVAFSYAISDGTAATAASATLDVTPVNDAPTTAAVNLPGMQEDGGPVVITAADLLANAADADGDALSVANLSASSGTLVANGNGTWSFTPAANASGPVAFTYTVTDGTASAAGSATLQVAPVNDAPATSPVSLPAMAEDGGAVTITAAQLLANASDVEGDALTVTGLSASSGTLVANGNGTWSFTPERNFQGTVTFSYAVSDGMDATAAHSSLEVTAAGLGTIPAPAPAPVAPAPAPAPSASAPPAPLVPAPAPAGPAPAPAPADSRGVRTSDSLQEALGAGMPAPIATFNSTPVSFAGAPARILLDADTSRVLRTVVFDRGGFELISADPDAQLVLGRFGIDSRGEFGRLDDIQRTLRSAALANQLDRLRESVREELDLDKSVTISVASVSLGLSLVYVLWLIRGGVLLGSYLSALPAWRLLDPLPVLSRVHDEEDGKDDEEPLDGGRRDGRDTLRGFG